MNKTEETKGAVNDAIIKEIKSRTQRLAFGTITFKVHNSKIVQIEVTEKTRFDDISDNEGGGGI